jgi:two-component system sensor histidine kinase RegB
VGRVTSSLRDRERELALATERARRHEHLASLTTLAAGAAHELGTPLSTIALVAKEMELASQRGEDGTALTEDAQLIRREVDRCRSILDRMRVDVLDDAANRPSTSSLGELLDQLREDLREREQPRLQVVTSEPMDASISGSRMLRRAVGVLLKNAFDASGPQGLVSLHFQRSGGRIMFEVRDSGAGMNDEVLRRAGEPFFTTKAPGEGMGLGLFLVRLVAETYRGRFELQSRPGGGTRSILELPEQKSERMKAEG